MVAGASVLFVVATVTEKVKTATTAVSWGSNALSSLFQS